MKNFETDTTGETKLEIKRAAQLSLTEIGVGSIGHGFKIPLTGQILSLNQLAFLLNAINRDNLRASSVFEISGIAAILKSFSPAGQKIGPMLSIVMQGFLFWLPTSLIGTNIVGQIFGATLLSIWAFIQPFITLFLIYGMDFFKILEFYFKRIEEDYSFIAVSLGYAVSLVIFVKILAAVTLVILSRMFKKKVQIISSQKVSGFVLNHLTMDRPKEAWKAALKDLFRPIFLLSFLLMIIFVWQINGTHSEKIWMSLRPLATAFVLFYVLRSPWVAQKLIELSRKSPLVAKIHSKAQSAFGILTSKD